MGTTHDIDAENGERRRTLDDIDPLIVLGVGVAALLAMLALVFIDPDRSSLEAAPAAGAASVVETPESPSSDVGQATDTTLRSAPPELAMTDVVDVNDAEAEPSSPAASPPPFPAELLDDAQRQMLRLYRSAFGRGPDGPGFAFWSEEIRSGTSLSSVAATFAGAEEFDRQFDEAAPTPIDLVTTIHRNGTGVAPDATTVATLLALLDTDGVAAVIVEVSESPATAVATGTNLD